MAKSGDITVTGGTPFIAAVQGDITPEMSLGQAAAAALAGSDDPLCLVVDLSTRTIKAYDVAAEGQNDPMLNVVPDNDAKVTPWTAESSNGDAPPTLTGEDSDGAHPGLINATYKIARSLSSLISIIEDELAKVGNANAKITVDQINNRVRVWTAADAPVVPNGHNALATITQTVAQNNGVVKNAFE